MTRTMALSADVVLMAKTGDLWQVLLITRANPPFEGCLALPGGYVEDDETFESAAGRELLEETGIEAPEGLKFLGVYDDPDRDPRCRMVTAAYLAVVPSTIQPFAGSDAASASWVSVTDLVESQVAFDHQKIIDDALNLADKKIREVSHG